MKAKISHNMISFVTVRRGNWILKISVYKNKQVLVVGAHCYDVQTIVRYFTHQDDAADFIEQLVIED